MRTRTEAHFAALSHERSAGALFRHLLGAVHTLDGNVSPRLAAAQRSLEQAEILARALHPGVDTWRIAKDALAEIARRDLDYHGWIKRISHELPHLAHIVPRFPQLVIRYLQRQRDRSTLDNTARLRELQREYRLTRILLWACAVCGGLLGAGAIWVVR